MWRVHLIAECRPKFHARAGRENVDINSVVSETDWLGNGTGKPLAESGCPTDSNGVIVLILIPLQKVKPSYTVFEQEAGGETVTVDRVCLAFGPAEMLFPWKNPPGRLGRAIRVRLQSALQRFLRMSPNATTLVHNNVVCSFLLLESATVDGLIKDLCSAVGSVLQLNSVDL